MFKALTKKITAVLFMIALALAFVSCGSDEDVAVKWPAQEQLNAISVSDIESVIYSRNAGYGTVSGCLTAESAKQEVLDLLLAVTPGEKTEAGTDDNALSVIIKTSGDPIKFDFEGDFLVLNKNSRYYADGADSLQDYFDGLSTNEMPHGPSDGEYDILEGYEMMSANGNTCVYGTDFMLIMPASDDWDIAKIDKDSFRIYLTEAAEGGYDGTLVTIRAYDEGNGSYKDLQSYHVAGISARFKKTFVAEYPTDARWDTEDKEQTEKYNELKEYLWAIGEGDGGSPLVAEGANW